MTNNDSNSSINSGYLRPRLKADYNEASSREIYVLK